MVERPRARLLMFTALPLAAVIAVLTAVTWSGTVVRAGRPIRTAPAVSSPGPSPTASPNPSPSPNPGLTSVPALGSTLPPSPTQLRVVGLGDSVPAGTACGCTSYVTLVGRQLAQRTGRVAGVTNLARGGLTTAELVDQLQDSTVRSAITHADLVIVTIGANDFDPSILTADECQPATGLSCYKDILADLRQELGNVLVTLNALRSAQERIVVTGYWNVFLDGAVGRAEGAAYVAASSALTLAANGVAASVSASQQVRYVDIYTPFKGADGTADCTALLTSDGDHPNAAGHQLIAATILTALAD